MNYLYDDDMVYVNPDTDWYLLHLDIDDPDEKVWALIRTSHHYDDLWDRIPLGARGYIIMSYTEIRFGEWVTDEEEEEEEGE